MYYNIKILIVDNNSDDVHLIRELLKDITNIQYELLHEESLNSTLKRVEKEKFDCILLNPNLSDNLGIDALKNLLNQCQEVPIVVLAAIYDEDIAIQSFHNGAQDYLVKSKINGDILSHSVQHAIERKKAEYSPREGEKKYRDIVNTILEGLWITDTEGKTTYVNKQLAKMLGYTEEEIEKEILNQPFFNFVDKSLQQEAKQFFERRKKGINDRYDFRFIKKDGSILWVTVSASPVFDKTGKFADAMGLLTDITDCKLLEQSLEKSLQEWNSTFDAIVDIICIIDLDGKITHCNNAATRLFKKPKEEFIGQTCWEALNCPYERLKNCPIISMQKSHKREISTIQIDDKWFRSSVDPIIDIKNNIVGGVHIISNITKYKLYQDALKESEEHYRTITEYSNDIIWTLDKNCNFTFFNKRAEQISGYKLEELKGKSFVPLIIEKDLDRAIDIFQSILYGSPQQFEITFINKYKRLITLSINATPIYSKGQITGTLSSGRDITETVKYAKELKILNEKLEASNKELQEFAYIASHDLQEPLRSIYGFTELLEERYKGKFDQDADEFIDYIIDGTKRMRQMIQDLLTLSRIGTRGNEFIPTNITNILKDVQKNLHSMIERNNATITIEEMPTVNADSVQLTQLFQNLIDNAIKFRKEENPHIHISVKQINGESNNRESDNRESNNRESNNRESNNRESNNRESNNREWIFSVKDNGIGIDQKDFNKLFKAFSRLNSREKYPGTGIGLTICKKIAERHGGRIWLESKFGQGSTFHFTIPFTISK